MKTTTFALITAALMTAANAAFAQTVPDCPDGFTATGEVTVNADGSVEAICVADAAPEPITFDTHGRRDITLAQLRGMMTTFGAVRIASADLAMGSPERTAVLAGLGPLWEFTPGANVPGLLYNQDNAGVTRINSGTTGEPLGVRVEQVNGELVFFPYPGENDCAVNDRPASPNMWKRVCQAEEVN